MDSCSLASRQGTRFMARMPPTTALPRILAGDANSEVALPRTFVLSSNLAAASNANYHTYISPSFVSARASNRRIKKKDDDNLNIGLPYQTNSMVIGVLDPSMLVAVEASRQLWSIQLPPVFSPNSPNDNPD